MAFRKPGASSIFAGILLLLTGVSAAICLSIFGPYTTDSQRYVNIAVNLARGNGFSAATQPPYDVEVFRPPLYPVFLAGLLRVGVGVYGVIAAQVALYFVSILIAMKIALRLTVDRWPAAVLGLLLAGNLPLIHWTASITTESLCTVLFCLCSWFLMEHLRRPCWWSTVVLGVSINALFFTRVTYVVLFPVAAACSAIGLRRRSLARYFGVLAIMMMLPVAAWVARNLTVMPDSFHPFGVGAGLALFGRAVELQEPDVGRRTARLLQNPDVDIVNVATDPRVQLKADENLFWQGAEVIRSHCFGFLRMSLSRVVFREWVEGYHPALPVAGLLIVAGMSSALLGLAYVGMAVMGAKWRVALPVAVLCFAVAAVHAPFATQARYTAPVRPVFYVFAVSGIAYMVAKAREWHVRRREKRVQ